MEASGQPPAISFEYTFDRTCAKVSKRPVQQVCLAVKVLTGHISWTHIMLVLATPSFLTIMVSCLQGNTWPPGVIYVGHLPLGLFEPQLKTYFEQFGKVLRLRLSRSKKVSWFSRMFPSEVWLGLKMSSDVPVVWGQITEPKVCWCVKLIACSHGGTAIKPMFPQKQHEISYNWLNLDFGKSFAILSFLNLYHEYYTFLNCFSSYTFQITFNCMKILKGVGYLIPVLCRKNFEMDARFHSYFMTCRQAEAKAMHLSSLTALKWPKSLQRQWTTTSWERDSSSVSIDVCQLAGWLLFSFGKVVTLTDV